MTKILDRISLSGILRLWNAIKRAIKICIYISWLFREIILSAIYVMQIIFFQNYKINPKIVLVHVGKYDTMQNKINAIYASSITLTPGTVAIDITEDGILVHGINDEVLSELQKGGMEMKIKKYIYQA